MMGRFKPGMRNVDENTIANFNFYQTVENTFKNTKEGAFSTTNQCEKDAIRVVQIWF
jgi:hypothetical protein